MPFIIYVQFSNYLKINLIFFYRLIRFNEIISTLMRIMQDLYHYC